MKPEASPNTAVPATILPVSCAVSRSAPAATPRGAAGASWPPPAPASTRRRKKALPMGSRFKARGAPSTGTTAQAKQTAAPSAEPMNTSGTACAMGKAPSARPHAASMQPAGTPRSTHSSASSAGSKEPAKSGTNDPTTSSAA